MKLNVVYKMKRVAFVFVGILLSFFILKTNTTEAYVYIKLAINKDSSLIEDSATIQERLLTNKVLKELEMNLGISDITKILGDREFGRYGGLNVFDNARSLRLIEVHLTLPTRNKDYLTKALGMISKDYIVDYENKFVESEMLSIKERLEESKEAYKKILSWIQKNNINSSDLENNYNSLVVFNQLSMIENNTKDLQSTVAIFNQNKAEQIGDIKIIERSDLLAITKLLFLGILLGLIFEYLFEITKRNLH